MKIGILTFWKSLDNYGQQLQCYALQKYLRSLGHDVFLIRYLYDKDILKESLIKRLLKLFNPQKSFKFFLKQINRKRIEQEQKSNDRQFEDFRKRYIVQSEVIYSSLNELQINPPQAEAYIVGSDQVWSFGYDLRHRLNWLHAFFLDFGIEETMRLSYAASWGRRDISDKEISEISPLIKRFDYISVREKSGIELCQKCGYNKAEWVPDPTLLLPAAIYRSLYNENDIRKPKSKYLFLYMLGNECEFDMESVYELASKKKIAVVYVSGNNLYDKYPKFFATIPEWLYLIDKAEYVITNSFHCGVFSIIFHKQFGIVPLTGKWSGMNSRFSSLFEMMGTGERFIDTGSFDVLELEYKKKEVKISSGFTSILN